MINFGRFQLIELLIFINSFCLATGLLSSSPTPLHTSMISPYHTGKQHLRTRGWSQGKLCSATASTPHLLTAFWQRAWTAYVVWSIRAITIYPGALFWQQIHCQEPYLCRNGDTENCTQRHASTRSSLSPEWGTFCNATGRAAALSQSWGFAHFGNISLLISDALELLTNFNIRHPISHPIRDTLPLRHSPR